MKTDKMYMDAYFKNVGCVTLYTDNDVDIYLKASDIGNPDKVISHDLLEYIVKSTKTYLKMANGDLTEILGFDAAGSYIIAGGSPGPSPTPTTVVKKLYTRNWTDFFTDPACTVTCSINDLRTFFGTMEVIVYKEDNHDICKSLIGFDEDNNPKFVTEGGGIETKTLFTNDWITLYKTPAFNPADALTSQELGNTYLGSLPLVFKPVDGGGVIAKTLIGKDADNKPIFASESVPETPNIVVLMTSDWINLNRQGQSTPMTPDEAMEFVGENLDKSIILVYNTSETRTEHNVRILTNYQITGGVGNPVYLHNWSIDYREEEHVVGTWTDGSPVYEKTWLYTSVAGLVNKTTIITVPNACCVSHDFSSPNVNDGTYHRCLDITNNTNNFTVQFSQSASASACTIGITLRYFKYGALGSGVNPLSN